MTNLELLVILGDVQGKYIIEAQALRSGGKKGKRLRYARQIAAVLALVLILTAFVHTAPGAATVEYVKEKVTSLIETLFPPKKMTIYIEGEEYEGNYAADGVEPEETAEKAKPGFAIYYDVDEYTMVKEGDTTYIRSNLDLPSDLPVCEIEITHLNLPYEQAASQERAELEGQWELTEAAAENRITFHLLSGHYWDSPVEVRYYISDEQGGCFRITSRYFLEAAEGHGVRFAAIADTFAVIPPQESEG